MDADDRGISVRSFLVAACTTLLLVAAGGLCFGWIGGLGGLVLAFVLLVTAIVLNVLAVLLDCLVNPLGRGREYTFRYPMQRPGEEDDKF